MKLELFGKDAKDDESTLTDEEIEERILRNINLLASRSKNKVIDLYFKLPEAVPERDAYLLTCFYNARKFISSILGGFYQIKMDISYPFLPGDILIFSHRSSYKKGDILYMMEFDETANYDFHYVIYDYKNDDGRIIAKSVIKDDKTKYAISEWKILGKKIYEIKFGTTEWEEYMTAAGEDPSKILDRIESNIGYVEKSDNFADKEKVLADLKKRRTWLKSFIEE